MDISNRDNTFYSKILTLNQNLKFDDSLLPDNFRVLNPFLENPETSLVMDQFYKKFYNDFKSRRFIIGINPSRHGAGVTGIPFTDTKRLKSACGIEMKSAHTHEISSVFMYEMINQYGGPQKFYQDFFINSPFPFAIIRKNNKGNWLNANYYDDIELYQIIEPFMIDCLQKFIELGLQTDKAFVLGIKNVKFLNKLNLKAKLFGELIPLAHPRFIQQYQSKNIVLYIDDYLRKFYGA